MTALRQADQAKLAALREALPATGAGIYLNTGTAGPIPAEGARAMREYEDQELRTGRADIPGWEAFLERMDECRGVLAAMVGAGPDAIALTHSTTDGMNAGSWAVDWRPGDRALTTNAEHAGLLGPLAAIRAARAVEIDIVDVEDGADEALVLERIDAAMTPRTRLISLSHVLWTNGATLPVAEIGRIAHARDAWFLVDAAQSVGAIDVSAAEIGADFIAFAGQKWLLGPEGTGGLWASPRAIAEARQSASGYLSYASLDLEGRGQLWDTARRFEATTFHRPSVIGLARSVGWLEMYVGLAWAFERAAGLARRAADALAAIPGVSLLTPRTTMATLVTFRVTGWTADELWAELSARVFAITRTIPAVEAVRISVGFFNSDEEIDRFTGAVAELASYTPATLPRRPAIQMLAAEPLGGR
ncbi:MAG: aminotransferase class V-fold PLP-dependent enzyme [Candidatus Limnocylindrales bacterium]